MDLIDRHPNAVFPLIAVFMGILPANILPMLAGFGSRFWTGVAIGTLIAIVPVVLLCLRRTRLQGGALLFLLSALATVQTAVLGMVITDEGVLEGSRTVEELSAAATIMGWSSLVLFTIGVIMGFTTGHREGHRAWVEFSGSGHVAVCGCGWRGEVVDEQTAFIKAGDHAGRVELRVRPPQGPPEDVVHQE